MRVVKVEWPEDENENEFDCDDDDELAFDRFEQERDKVIEAEGLFYAHYNSRGYDFLPMFDEQLAVFGLEIVQFEFDEGDEDYAWRIEKRVPDNDK